MPLPENERYGSVPPGQQLGLPPGHQNNHGPHVAVTTAPPRDQHQDSLPGQPVENPPVSIQPRSINNTTIVVAPSATYGIQAFGPDPKRTRCTACNNDIVTDVDYESGTMVWVICAVCCLVGCVLCACIPFCVDSFKDSVHRCPNCQANLGRFHKM